MSGHILANRKIGLFGRGGAGKSTTTILLAHALRARGYGVCILDADSTNIGMHMAIGASRRPASLVDHFGGMAFSGGSVACPVEDPTPLENAAVSLADLPAEFVERTADGVTLMTAGKLVDRGLGPGCDGPMTKVTRDVTVSDASQPMVTLVDCKAGYEDSARGVIAGLDWALVVVDPSVPGVEMALTMHQMFQQMQAGARPATAHMNMARRIGWANRIFAEARLQGVFAVLNRIHSPEVYGCLADVLIPRGVKIIGSLPFSADIAESWLRGSKIDPAPLRQPIEQIACAIEKAQEQAGRP